MDDGGWTVIGMVHGNVMAMATWLAEGRARLVNCWQWQVDEIRRQLIRKQAYCVCAIKPQSKLKDRGCDQNQKVVTPTKYEGHQIRGPSPGPEEEGRHHSPVTARPVAGEGRAQNTHAATR
jgi:hypothetical protein